jgi:hypothetical protein
MANDPRSMLPTLPLCLRSTTVAQLCLPPQQPAL